MTIRLEELAERFGLGFRGDPDHVIVALAPLASAGPGELSFLANPSYTRLLAESRAGAVVMGKDLLDRWDGNALVSGNPYADWARIAEFLNPRHTATPGIHPSAWIDPTAVIDESASIGPQCSVGPRCHVRARVEIGPGCVLDSDVVIDDDTRLVAKIFLGSGTRLGKRVLIHPGAVIGADGFGLAMDQGHWLKVPQLGNVCIGDDCEIGANTTIDRGAIEDTVLEEDVRLDNQVQIAHNVRIGAHTAIAGCVGVAGSTRIGRYCMIAGACGIGGHLAICDHVIITAMSTVLDSIDEPGEYGSGIPARPHARWKRILVRLGQLDEWARRLRKIENKQP